MGRSSPYRPSTNFHGGLKNLVTVWARDLNGFKLFKMTIPSAHSGVSHTTLVSMLSSLWECLLHGSLERLLEVGDDSIRYKLDFAEELVVSSRCSFFVDQKRGWVAIAFSGCHQGGSSTHRLNVPSMKACFACSLGMQEPAGWRISGSGW